MIRAFVLYSDLPDPERYAQHVELCMQVPGFTAFRHGPVTQTIAGEPLAYYAEYEFPDMETLTAAAGPSFAAPGEGRRSDGLRAQRVRRGHWLSRTHPRRSTRPSSASSASSTSKGGGRATIAFNRPEVLNAFDFRTLRELTRAVEDASWDDGVRVIVLTGAGERAFSTGADLKEQARHLAERPRDYWKWMGQFIDAHDELRDCGKPTLARVDGLCVGGGNEFHMACDLSIASDWSTPLPPRRAPARLGAGGRRDAVAAPPLVGDRRAREMIMLCEEIPPQRARSSGGWSTRSVPREQLDAAVDDGVEKLAAKLPESTRYAKHQLNFWRDLSWHMTIGHAKDWLTLHAGDRRDDRGRARALPREAAARPRAHTEGLVSDDPLVLAERRGAVGLVTLDPRPRQLNALSDALMAELDGALSELEADDAELRVAGARPAGSARSPRAPTSPDRRAQRDRHAEPAHADRSAWERVKRLLEAADRGRRRLLPGWSAASSR